MSDDDLTDTTADLSDGAGEPSAAASVTAPASARAEDPVLVVGLGASAGGLEALREFFDRVPPTTGCAFVVVQHLSPDYKSIMDELLARNTSMPVRSAEHGVRLQPDSVYLIPPRKNLTLQDGHLQLAEQHTDRGVHLPIDVFFRSLAEDAQLRSVAIVLSGTGSDGSRGIRNVKEAGGLVLVQDPESARFDGMPVSAVRTGVPDFVLAPADLADYLERYVNHPLVADPDSPESARLENDGGILAEIFGLLRERSGIDFSHYKPSTVARRIERRMGINQIADVDSYLGLLKKNDIEVQTLGREMLINVTRFFRDTEAFAWLEQHVITRLIEESGSDTEVRVWVAGCSTGEEAYSLAILLDEAVRRGDTRKRVKIFATDVDVDAIADASLGRYAAEIRADVSRERLERYFTASGDGYSVRQEVRQRVVFATHNMISDPPFSNIDLICCRNVLIYFQQPIQQKVIAAFHFSLRRRGVAFFGKSESVGELKSHFEPLKERYRLFRKRQSATGPITSSLRLGSPENGGLRPVANLLRSYRAAPREHLFDHIKDSLINDHVPACLILDADHHAVHIYGGANRYLNRFSSGRVSTDVHDIIAEELSVPVSTALTRAENENKPVYYSSIPITLDGREISLDLEAEFFGEKNGRPAHFVIMFTDRENESHGRTRVSEAFDIGAQTRQRIRDLESELLQKQESLQVSNEELETTNEELQSANEELMSSNEELQSANEELQSVNEELFTVNHEYQEKILELSVAGNDLDHVLSLTSIALIFVDASLRVRKFTSLASRYFSLMPTDIGRPLHHISGELDYPQLFDDFDRVLGGGEAISREVFTVGGRLVEIKLIRNGEGGVDGGADDPEDERDSGAVLALIDLSARMQQDRARLERAVAPDGLPLPASDGASGSSGTPEPSGPERVSVLLLDDDDEDRHALRRQLDGVEEIALSVHEAHDLSGGLAVLADIPVDVCLIDFRLGGDTAVDFTRACREHGHTMPIIILSGNTRAELHEQLPSLESTRFVNKEEVSPLLLELTIMNALEAPDEGQR